MNSEAAVEVLGALAATDEDLTDEPTFVEWATKASALLRSAFGAGSVQVDQFEAAVTVKREGYRALSAIDSLKLWRRDAANRGKAVLRAAIFTLETLTDDSGPLDDASIDPELWAHVQGLVANNDWAKVPASVVIFVEDRVRRWAEDPRQGGGAAMVGKSLYATALNDSGPLRLGRQPSEWEGWRSLGVGLAQAIGNVDRHRIQVRDDVRRYALGVLGLGSLLLTQLRYEHPAAIKDAEADDLATRESNSD